MSIIGVGLQGSDRALDELRELGIRDVLILNEGFADAVKLGFPCVWRIYSPDRMGLSPDEAAWNDYQYIQKAFAQYQGLDKLIWAVIPANELNLDGEHASRKYGGYWKSIEGYQLINSWLVQWAISWRRLCVG
jgi:hypothetical protein